MSGLGCLQSQKERLTRIVAWWVDLVNRGQYMLILGDINLDCLRWNDPDYNLISLVEEAKNFLADTAMSQQWTSLQGSPQVAQIGSGL